jgi:hypothetical protein
MRMGEVRGLRWGDVEDGLIHIRHNWIDGDGELLPRQPGIGLHRSAGKAGKGDKGMNTAYPAIAFVIS